MPKKKKKTLRDAYKIAKKGFIKAAEGMDSVISRTYPYKLGKKIGKKIKE